MTQVMLMNLRKVVKSVDGNVSINTACIIILDPIEPHSRQLAAKLNGAYFIPFMLSKRPLPDLVDMREEVFETREKDLTSSMLRLLELVVMATCEEVRGKRLAESSSRVPMHMRTAIDDKTTRIARSKPFVGSLA